MYFNIVNHILNIHLCIVFFIDAEYSQKNPTWVALARVAMLCNRAEFRVGQENVPILKR